MQAPLGVDQLNRESVVIQKPAGEGDATSGYHANDAVLRANLGVGIEHRPFQLDGAADRSDPVELRAESGAFAPDLVALEASTLALEKSLSPNRVAGHGNGAR